MFNPDSLKEIEILKQSERQKVLLVEGLDGNRYLKREISGDKREIYKALQKINHVNIPKIYYVGFDSDTIIIEEYVEGISLSDFMEQNRALNKKQVYSIAKQILSALDKLHEFEIIHRDIKPDNILLDKSNHIWLTDYDIARIYRKEVRRDTETIGTFGYAPIEQYGMLPTDFKTDIYAFGVTLKTLLDYSDIKGFLYKVAEKCKRLDPAERYKSAKKVKNVLFLHSLAPVIIWIVVLVLISVLAIHNLNDEKETVLDIPQESQTIPEGHITEPIPENNEIVPEEKPIKNETVANQEQAKEIKEPENTSFEGTFSVFQDGPNEEQYRNYSYYSQACIFSMQSPWEHLIFIDDVHKTGKLKLGKNETIIAADVTLSNGMLSVKLSDDNSNSFIHQFQYNNQYEYEEYYTENRRKNADIICYDFNGDGATELLIGLSEGSMGSFDKQFYNNVNYCIAWCVMYDENTGFKLCDGDMFSKGYSFLVNESIRKLNVAWEDIGDITGYLLEDDKIKAV